MRILLQVLEMSAKKHGEDKPLTLGHLLNIVKMVNELEISEENSRFLAEEEALNSIHDTYGSN